MQLNKLEKMKNHPQLKIQRVNLIRNKKVGNQIDSFYESSTRAHPHFFYIENNEKEKPNAGSNAESNAESNTGSSGYYYNEKEKPNAGSNAESNAESNAGSSGYYFEQEGDDLVENMG